MEERDELRRRVSSSPGPTPESEEQYLYLTTRGRTSGMPRQIEIWFVEDAGRYFLLSGRNLESHWVKNILSDSRVQVRVGKQELKAFARVLDEGKDAERYQRAQTLMREKYGWGEGLPVELTKA